MSEPRICVSQVSGMCDVVYQHSQVRNPFTAFTDQSAFRLIFLINLFLLFRDSLFKVIIMAYLFILIFSKNHEKLVVYLVSVTHSANVRLFIV